MSRLLGVAGTLALLLWALSAPAFGAQPAAPAPARPGGQAAKPPETPASVEARLSDQILQDLEKKRRELEQRETELRREESRLQELRADIKKRIDTLTEIEARIQKALEKTEATKDDRMEHLVRAYTAMAPDAAAQLINSLEIGLAVQILRNMQVKRAGAILAVVQPERAARISELLARAKAQ